MKKLALLFVALFCVSAFAQNLPNAAAGKNKDTLAVYVTGIQPIGEAQGAPNVMGEEMEMALSRSKHFIAVNRTDDILGVLTKEHGYTRSGAVNDAQIKKIGNQLGVQYLCIVRISVSGRGYYVEASFVDVEGARIISKSTAASRLEGYNEQMAVAQKLARELTGVDLGTVQQTTPVQPVQPAQETKTAPSVEQTFTDSRDGKSYRTIAIGKQTWMAENLNYATSGSQCYANESSNCEQYGRLYHWYTAMGVCPVGWHLPRESEWKTLTGYVGGDKKAGKKLKSASGWNKNGNGTDDYGFSALPGGYGHSTGGFFNAGKCGYWWTATENNYDAKENYHASAGESWFRDMNYNNEYVGGYYNYRYNYKTRLYSVRCVQD
jgi:uncharacterized protein (TIGR02145 family)